MSMNSSLAAIVCGRSKASSVNPVSAPSASAISLTGMLMLTTDIAAWIPSSMVSRFFRMSLRLPIPYTTVERPTAMYGATDVRGCLPSPFRPLLPLTPAISESPFCLLLLSLTAARTLQDSYQGTASVLPQSCAVDSALLLLLHITTTLPRIPKRLRKTHGRVHHPYRTRTPFAISLRSRRRAIGCHFYIYR